MWSHNVRLPTPTERYTEVVLQLVSGFSCIHAFQISRAHIRNDLGY